MFIFALGLVLPILPTISALHESYEAEYFSNVSLPCNFTKHGLSYPGLVYPIRKYWVLPNGTVLWQIFQGDDRFNLHQPNLYEFTLNVSGINDVDFGIYDCVLLWNNYDYKIDVIRVGLNVDGPYYERVLSEFRQNVLIGGIIGGCVFFVFLVACIVCSCRNSRMSREHDRCQCNQQHARLQSIYGYESNPGVVVERMGPENKYGQGNVELYAQVNKQRPSMMDRRTMEDISTQSAHL